MITVRNVTVITYTLFLFYRCPYCGKGFADNSDLKRHKQVHESTPGFIPIRPKEEPTPSSSTTTSSTSHHISPTVYHHQGAPITVVMTTASSLSQGRQASDFMVTSSSSPYVDNNNSTVNGLIGAAGDLSLIHI